MKGLKALAGETQKFIRGFTAAPAPLVFQCLGKVPVVQGHDGANIIFTEFVYQSVVKIQTLLIELARALRKYPRPGDGQAV